MIEDSIFKIAKLTEPIFELTLLKFHFFFNSCPLKILILFFNLNPALMFTPLEFVVVQLFSLKFDF